jgi:hypothetical protein
MSTISLETKLYKIRDWTILRLPQNASAKLPSRALTMVKGTINGFHFKAALEPDGKGSHWFKLDKTILNNVKANAGDTVKMDIEPTKDWIEPEIPDDFKKALSTAPKAKALWNDVTPNAHWDWIRWIRAVKTPETRQKHIEVALSKLNAGTRRPCCFNRNLCSEAYVSHNWALLDPTQ